MPGFIISNGEDSFGGPALSNAIDRNKDWLRNHRFTLLDFFGQLPLGSQKEFLMLKDVTLPDKTISELSIKTPGTTYKFAAQANFTDLKLSFYGSTTLLTKCLQLADQPHSIGEGIKDYDYYKGEVSFIINDTGSLRGTGVKYTYSGAWVSEVNHGQLTYTSSDIKLITVNVKFDFFEVVSGSATNDGTSIVKNSSPDPASILDVAYNNSKQKQ